MISAPVPALTQQNPPGGSASMITGCVLIACCRITPIGRAAEPEDIPDVIIFLLSDRNRYMVGETVIVNGGYLIP